MLSNQVPTVIRTAAIFEKLPEETILRSKLPCLSALMIIMRQLMTTMNENEKKKQVEEH